jgi:hypothetical protein
MTRAPVAEPALVLFDAAVAALLRGGARRSVVVFEARGESRTKLDARREYSIL